MDGGVVVRLVGGITAQPFPVVCLLAWDFETFIRTLKLEKKEKKRKRKVIDKNRNRKG
jgi:hypothetical protein